MVALQAWLCHLLASGGKYGAGVLTSVPYGRKEGVILALLAKYFEIRTVESTIPGLQDQLLTARLVAVWTRWRGRTEPPT